MRPEDRHISPPGGASHPEVRGTAGRTWLQTLGVIPAAVVPLLPSFTCPACLAAYAGVLSSLGMGFVLRESFLAPLIALSLLVTLLSVAWSTRSHRDPRPLALTVVGSLAIVAGRLVWQIKVVLYLGVALLIAATLWNLWLKRPRRRVVRSAPLRLVPARAPGDADHHGRATNGPL